MRRTLVLVPLLAALSASESPVDVHGFVSQGYVATDDNAYFTPDTLSGGSGDFREIGLTITAEPIDRTWVGIQLMSRDLGDDSSGVIVDWAFGKYTIPTAASGWEASVCAGRIKTGHALYNDTRDLDVTRTTVFLPEVIYWTSWHDLYMATNGGSVSLQSPRSSAGTLSFNAFYGSQNFDNDEGLMADSYVEYYGQVADRITIGAQFGAQATWETPVDGLMLKLSWMAARDWSADWENIDADATSGDIYWDTDEKHDEYIFSAEYSLANWRLVGEASYWNERSNDRYSTFNGVTANLASYDWRDYGNAAYATINWQFHPRWDAAATAQWMIERYEDNFGANSAERVFAYGGAVRWSITDHWLVKAEFMLADGTAWLREQDQPSGTLDDDTWAMVALRTTFDF